MNIHKDIQQQLLHTIENNAISHALLFYGKSGYGALPLAIWYAQQLICNEGSERCLHKVKTIQHADLHFTYPIANTDEIKGATLKSADFLKYWRKFIEQTPFGDRYTWMQTMGIEQKQGLIRVSQSQEILQTLSLSSFEGGYKVMIIWYPETMNAASANKILKILEEPPAKTVFILVTEAIEELLPTIISRCQNIEVPRLSRVEIEEVLVQQYSVEPNLASKASKQAQGDVNIALESLLYKTESFETLFVQWVRNAFRAKNDVSALQDIYEWSQEIASWNNREKHKQFLSYCADIFRNALVQNYGAPELLQNQIRIDGFKWNGFTPYIHGANIEEILTELNEASFHIERNGNAKIIFLDMGIKMTRLIHKAEEKPTN